MSEQSCIFIAPACSGGRVRVLEVYEHARFSEEDGRFIVTLLGDSTIHHAPFTTLLAAEEFIDEDELPTVPTIVLETLSMDLGPNEREVVVSRDDQFWSVGDINMRATLLEPSAVLTLDEKSGLLTVYYPVGEEPDDSAHPSAGPAITSIPNPLITDGVGG